MTREKAERRAAILTEAITSLIQAHIKGDRRSFLLTKDQLKAELTELFVEVGKEGPDAPRPTPRANRPRE